MKSAFVNSKSVYGVTDFGRRIRWSQHADWILIMTVYLDFALSDQKSDAMEISRYLNL